MWTSDPQTLIKKWAVRVSDEDLTRGRKAGGEGRTPQCLSNEEEAQISKPIRRTSRREEVKAHSMAIVTSCRRATGRRVSVMIQPNEERQAYAHLGTLALEREVDEFKVGPLGRVVDGVSEGGERVRECQSDR